jgi:50S ribosomal subunit-associated GTPase HflX
MPGTPKPDAVILVLDSLHLTRQLMLAAPVLEVGLPTLVLLNMSDLMESRGGRIDTLKLARELGAPVALISATHGTGLDAVPLFLNQHTDRTSTHKPLTLPVARQRRQHPHLGRPGQPPHRLPGPAFRRKQPQDRQHPPPPHLGTAAFSRGRRRRL